MDVALRTTLCLSDPAAAGAAIGWSQLNLAPAILVPLILLAALHARLRARRDAGAGTIAAALGGHLLLAFALVSALCRQAAVLASAHMVQHIVLVCLAPALLALGGLRFGGRALVSSALACTLATWAWHVPALYEAALRSAPVHLVMIASLVGTGLWLWSGLMAARMAAIPVLLAMMMQTGLLGAILTFAPAPLYAPMVIGTAALGGSPLDDQQLAGLLMWVPMAPVFLGAALWHTARVVSVAPTPRAGLPTT